MRQWAEPFVKLRLPYIMSLRRDPFERAEFNSNTYLDWMVDHVPQLYQMQAVVAAHDRGLREVPAAAETRLVQPGRGAGGGDEVPRLERRPPPRLTGPCMGPSRTWAGFLQLEHLPARVGTGFTQEARPMFEIAPFYPD